MSTWQPTQRERVAKALRDAVAYAPRQYQAPEGAAVRIILSNAFLRGAAEKLFGLRPAEEQLHIFGVRSASPDGETVLRVHEPAYNRYDDTVGTFGTALRLFPATVDPGRTWTQHPSVSAGAAHLEPGHYLYQIGKHKGKPALVQAGPVTVRRDRDRDGTAEAGEPLASGYFGINIHRGSRSDTMPVDSWSAGCQVLPVEEFVSFYTLIATSGQRRFDYWLFEGPALGKLVTP